MKNHNKGLTLVELLVSVAVLSIVTLGIGGLLRLAAVQYYRFSKFKVSIKSIFPFVSLSASSICSDVFLESA